MKKIMLGVFLLLSGYSYADEQNDHSRTVIYEYRDFPARLTENILEYSWADYFQDMAITNTEDVMNTQFSPNTELNNRVLPYDHPYSGEAYFLKEFPSKDGFRFILFTYWNRDYSDEHNIKLPTIELQVFDSSMKVVDKMIVVDGVMNECAWNRRFTMYSDYTFETIDKDSCWDLETDEYSSEEQIVTYTIDKQGDIKMYRVGSRINTGKVQNSQNMRQK